MSASSSARSRRGLMGSSKTSINHGSDPASLLGFRFRDPSLFRRALVHRSYCNEHGLDAAESYERLEFLGDAVLELTISAHLYRQFSGADEGQLTKARSSLVRGEALAKVARRWGLGERLLVGKGVEASGGRDQNSVLAAVLEAVIAAVYLDQGMEAAREFITVNMIDELADVTPELVEGPPAAGKSQIQIAGIPARTRAAHPGLPPDPPRRPRPQPGVHHRSSSRQRGNRQGAGRQEVGGRTRRRRSSLGRVCRPSRV